MNKFYDLTDDETLLDLLFKDMMTQKEQYKPTIYWREYSNKIYKNIKLEGIVNFRRNFLIGKGYTDAVLNSPTELIKSSSTRKIFSIVLSLPIINKIQKLYSLAINFHFLQEKRYKENFFRLVYEKLRKEILIDKEIPFSLLGNPTDTIKIGNKEISNFYLEQILRLNIISKSIDFKKVNTVCEIGSGFGTNIHLLNSLFPNIKKFLIVDIPPMLYVTNQYLKSFYPNDIIDYRKVRDLKRIEFSKNDKKEIIIIPSWLFHKFEAENIDYFVNHASFQEMEKDIVNIYIKKIINLNPKYISLYTLPNGLINNFLGQNEPITSAYLLDQFDHLYNFKKETSVYDPYYSVMEHLIGISKDHCK